MTTENNSTPETNNKIAVIEKIKSFAIGIIGAMFVTMGFTYFQEQASYNVPRILLPIYSLFGNVGLAIGLIILGAILFIWAYLKFVKNQGKPIIISLAFIAFIGLGIVISLMSDKNGILKDHPQSNTTENKVNNATRPKLDHQQANAYLDKLEQISADMEKAKNNNDNAAFKTLDSEYDQLRIELSALIPELSKTDLYSDFMHYNAQVMEKN